MRKLLLMFVSAIVFLPNFSALACKMTAIGGSTAFLTAVLAKVREEADLRDYSIRKVEVSEKVYVVTLTTWKHKDCVLRFTASAGADCSMSVVPAGPIKCPN